MDSFQIDSYGLTKGEFMEAIHRFSLRFFAALCAIGLGVYIIIGLMFGFQLGYLIFPGSVVLALILFFEMKAQGNYAKFDYMGTDLHFRFTPDGWAVIRNNEIQDKGEYTWAETAYLWQTPKTVLLCPDKSGASSYTLPKRSLTQDQLQAILSWYQSTSN